MLLLYFKIIVWLLVTEYTDEGFSKVSSFLVIIASKTFTLSLNKSDVKNDIVKHFWRKSSLAHFRPGWELSGNLMQVTPFISN